MASEIIETDDDIRRVLKELEDEEKAKGVDVEVEAQIDSDDDEEVLHTLVDRFEEYDVEDQVIVNSKLDTDQEHKPEKKMTVNSGKKNLPPSSSSCNISKDSKRRKTEKGHNERHTNLQAKGEVEKSRHILKVDECTLFGKKQCFAWNSQPVSLQLKVKKRNIIRTRRGPRGEACEAKRPIDCFSLFLSRDILDKIVVHTNQQIQINREKYKIKNNPTLKDTTMEEIKALLGLLLLGAALKSNHVSQELLFNQSYSGVHYIACFSKERFKFLLICLRFDDKATRSEREKVTRLAHISEIWESFLNNCRTWYEPGSYLTIDEQLVGFRGRVPFMMYIPSKPDKYGMKVIMMCDSATYYMVDAIAYTGKGSSPKKIPAAEHFVGELIGTVKGSNRNITVDNWFSSIPLAKMLLENGLTMVGTIKKNKRELPPDFIKVDFQNREVGTSFFLYEEDITAVSYKAKSNTLVTLISTLHDDGSVRQSSGKPEIIHNYNETKGGVDSMDQMCHNMDCKRKTNRWPLTYFYNMLNLASVNAYVIYAHNKFASKDKPLSRMDFMLMLHKEMTHEWLAIRSTKPGIQRNLRDIIVQTAGPSRTLDDTRPDPSESPTKRTTCNYCDHKKRRMTTSYCYRKNCRKPICLEHSKKICIKCTL